MSPNETEKDAANLQDDEQELNKKSFYDKDMLEWDSEIAEGRGRSIMPEPEAEERDLEPDPDSEPNFLEVRSEHFEDPVEERVSGPPRTPLLMEGQPPEDYEEGGMAAGFFVSDSELGNTPENPEHPDSSNLPEHDFFWEFETSPPGPTSGGENKSMSLIGDLTADKNLLNQEITPEKIKLLLRRSEVARQRVNQEIDSIQLAQELLDVLRSGKTLLLAGVEHFEEAERLFNEVEYRLAYNKRVKFWSGTFAFKLLWYEIAWLFVLGIGAFIFPPILSGFMSGEYAFLPINVPAFVNPDDVYTLVSTMIWGGLGGVVGAMYSLWRHVSVKQDFNPQHSIWYFTQPLMGMPIGAFIFIALRIGIILTYDQTINISNPLIIYIIAWIAGFQQNVVYEIVRQIIKLFRIERSNNPTSGSR